MRIFFSLMKFRGFINGLEMRKSVPVKLAEDAALVGVNGGKVGSV